jgi:nicotinate-nucleotide pyrophosphorylase (carboxylating)
VAEGHKKEERFLVKKEFTQIDWDERLVDDCRQLVRLAVREDLDRFYDWTTAALAPADAVGRAVVVARQAGTVAGLAAAELALDEMDANARWRADVRDGEVVGRGSQLAELSGSVRDLLTSERLLLNLIGRLSGIATLTSRYVEAVRDTAARIYDTRKTTPGWRRLEKYAVRCGGGCNHRTGLFDAVLIKDNHLGLAHVSPGEAVRRARQFLREMLAGDARAEAMIIEVEVDTLDQLDDALPAGPDLVLLDNMSTDELRAAVRKRNTVRPEVELEASGGVTLDTVRPIAETGVDRISVGAVTHSAISLDVGLDWCE